ncbi:HlyD family type I secretion periplasmic adaptor subunit [Phormidesmis priestleyi]
MLNRIPPETKLSRLPSEHKVTISAPVETAHWSPPLQTLLDKPASALPARLAIGGLAFSLCFTSWAWLGQMNEVAHAQGKLIPKGAVYKVNPIETGKVSQVLVTEGQTVKAGQPLLELDPQLATTEVEGLEKQLTADQTQLNQTQTLMTQLVMQAQTRVAIGRATIASQKVAAMQAKGNTLTTQAIVEQLQADAAAQQERLNRLQPLAAEGAIAQEQVFQVEQSLRERQRTITEHQGSLQQSRSEIDRLQAEFIQKQAEDQQYQLEAQQQIQQLRLKVSELQAKIEQTQTLLKVAQAKRKQRVVYAPVSGKISTLNIRNPGEVVQPGQPLAEITPSNKPLVLSAILPDREAGLVKVGMRVQVKLDAYPYQDYGIVSGKVTAISADAQPDEKLGQVYRVEVQLDRHSVTKESQKVLFRAGQTATAEIVTRQRRIADILLDPLKQLQGSINL